MKWACCQWVGYGPILSNSLKLVARSNKPNSNLFDINVHIEFSCLYAFADQLII